MKFTYQVYYIQTVFTGTFSIVDSYTVPQ